MAELRIQVSIDRRAFDQSVKDIGRVINQLSSQQVRIGTGALDGATSSATQTAKAMDSASASVQKTGESFAQSAAKMARWMALGNGIVAVKRAFGDALDVMKNVDTQLVDIAKVTDFSADQIRALSNRAYEMATAFGRAADEVLAAETAFARAGYGERIEQMAEIALLTQNVGDVTSEQATKFLLAADAAWQLGGNADALRKILDGVNQVTNRNAVDMSQMTDGITVAASVFATAGETAQTFTALLGAGTAATQRSGNEVARALRTILMNLRQIKGETEDGELIDGESIARASKALREFAGIQTIVDGELRKGSDVLSELAGKWGDLDTIAQSAIAEALAGKRQANVLTAILGDWESVEKMLVDFATGIGSTLKENQAYLDSWVSKTTILSSAWSEFISKTVESGSIKALLDNATVTLDALGDLETVAGGALGYLAAAKLPALVKGFGNLRDEVRYLPQLFRKGESSASAFGNALQTTAGKTAMAQAGIALLTTAIVTVIAAYNSWHAAQERSISLASQKAEELTNKAEQLNALVEQYGQLGAKSDWGAAELEIVKSLQQDIVDLVGAQADGLDMVNGKLGEQSQMLSDLKVQYANDIADDLRAEVQKAQNALLSLFGDKFDNPIASFTTSVLGSTEGYEAFEELVAEAKYIKRNLSQIGFATEVSFSFANVNTPEDAQAAIKELEILRKRWMELGFGSTRAFDDMNKSLESFTEYLTGYNTALNSYLENQTIIDLGAILKTTTVDTKQAFDALVSVIQNSQTYSDQYKQMLIDAAKNAFPQFAQAVTDVGKSMSETTERIDAYATAIEIAQKKLELIERAQKQMSDGGEVTDELYDQLITIFGDLGDSAKDTGTGFYISAEALDTLNDGLMDELKALGLVREEVRDYVRDLVTFKDELEGAAEAKKAFDDAMSAPDKADAFKGYQEAVRALNEEIEAGRLNSNKFWTAASYLYGSSQLEQLGWNGESVATYHNGSAQSKVFDPETKQEGTELLDLLMKMADASGQIRDEAGNVLGTIRKVKGVWDFSVPKENMDALAKQTGLLVEELYAAFGALDNFGHVSNLTLPELMNAIEGIGVSVEKNANGLQRINLKEVVEALARVGASDKDIAEVAEILRTMEGVDLSDTDASLVDIAEAARDTKGATDEATASVSEANGEAANLNTTLQEAGETSFASLRMEISNNVVSPLRKAWTWAGNLSARLNGLSGAKIGVNTGESAGGLVGAIASLAGRAGSSIAFLFKAKGDKNFKGGRAVVNDGDGPEMIIDGGDAFIANGGKPAVVELSPGAKIYSAEETRGMYGGLRNTIPAFATGTITDIRKVNVKKSSDAAPDTTNDAPTADDYWSIVEAYVQYGLKKAQHDVNQQQHALDNLEKARDKLTKPIEKEIEGLNDATDALEREIKIVERARDDAIKPLDDEIEALKDAKEIQDEQLELAEKQKAVEEARAALQNAQNERTVRYFNRETGQWEWRANEKDIRSVKNNLADAERALADFIEEMKITGLERARDTLAATYDDQIAAAEYQQNLIEQNVEALESQSKAIEKQYAALMEPIEAQKEYLQEQYDAFERQWDAIELAVSEPAGSISEALGQLANSGIPMFTNVVGTVGSLLNQLAVSMGMSGLVSGYGHPSDTTGAISLTEGTAARIGSNLLVKGDRGQDVNYLQQALLNAGYSVGNTGADGIFGSNTLAAVKAYQKARGLKIDGKAGPETIGSLVAGNFDQGGIAYGKGLMAKDTDRPEIMLSPEMTKQLLTPSKDSFFNDAMERLGVITGVVPNTTLSRLNISNRDNHSATNTTNYFNVAGLHYTQEQAEQTYLSDVLRTLCIYEN